MSMWDGPASQDTRKSLERTPCYQRAHTRVHVYTHTHTHSFRQGQIRQISEYNEPNVHIPGIVSKPEYLKKTHTDKGGTCKLYR